MGEGDLDLLAALLVHPAEQALGPLVLLAERRDAVLGEHLVEPLAVVLGDHRLQLVGHPVGIELARARIRRGHHHVDAVGLSVDVVVDPVELDVELLGREGQCTEHAEPAGAAHGGDDVAAVAEGEDRQVDAERVADARVHYWTSCTPEVAVESAQG